MANEKDLMKQFEAETGKRAIWRGIITKGYLKWKQKRLKKDQVQSSNNFNLTTSQLSEIISTFNKIESQFQDFQARLSKLESAVFTLKEQISTQEISKNHLFNITKAANNSSEKCGICSSDIKNGAKIFQEGLHSGIVCSTCHDNIPEEDLELMANLFLAYGGYFGQLRRSDYSIENLLKEIASTFPLNSSKEVTVEELNIKMMHKALLYGVLPKQFIKGLKTLLEL